MSFLLDPAGDSQETVERLAAVLNALSKNLLTSRTDFLNQLAQAASELLSVPVCVVWERAEQEQKLRIVAASAEVDDAFRAIELDLDAVSVQKTVANRAVKSMLDARKPSAFYGHSREARERGWVSLLSAPMMVADRLIGMLDVYTREPRRFAAWEKDVFGAFANYAALSIHNQNTRRRLVTVNDLMHKMTDAQNVEELLGMFLRGGLALVGATRGSISTLDLRTGRLDIVLASGDPPQVRRLQWGEGITGLAVTSGEPINVGDVTQPPWDAQYREFWPDTRSELAIPIMVTNAEIRVGTDARRGPKPIGVFNVESSRPHAFTPAAQDLLWALAQQAAIVIQKLEFDDRLARLEHIKSDVVRLETFEETAQTIVDAVASQLGYDFVNLSLVKPETRRIQTTHVAGIEPGKVAAFIRMADHALDGDDIQGHIVRNGVAEVPGRHDSRFDSDIYTKFGHERLIRVFVPMRLPQANRVIGTIEAGYDQTFRRHIYERDVRMLQAFADYAALALEHKKLLGFPLYVASVLNQALAAVAATQGSLLLLHKSTNTLEVIERKGHPYGAGTVRLEVGKGIAGMAVRDRRPYRVGDVRLDPAFVAPRRTPEYASMLAVPIVHGARAIGAICVHSETPNKFSQADEDRLVEIARGFAPTMEELAVDTFVGQAKRLTQLVEFHGVAQELARLTGDVPRLREQITKAAESVLEANPVVLYEYNERTRSFDTPPTWSGDIRDPAAMSGPVLETDAPSLVVAKKQSHYTGDATNDELLGGRRDPAAEGNPARLPFAHREGIESSAAILLYAGNEIVGVLFLNYRSPHTFAENEKTIISGFAADAAVAIQAARKLTTKISSSRQAALEQTSYEVGHRVPDHLAKVDVYLRRLRGGIRHADAPAWAERAFEENLRAKKRIEIFRDFGKGIPFPRPHTLGPADLEGLISASLSRFRRRDTVIDVNIDRAAPVIRTDSDRLEDDFIAFLHDSQRHRPADVHVTVTGECASARDLAFVRLPARHAFLRIVYTDNGPGIPMEIKSRVFDKFFTTKGGSGLGLAIAKFHAVTQHGQLVERGTPGKGVRFEMYLPGEPHAD